jgi:hypothetical protein
MVTSESNRAQSPTTAAPFERQAQGVQTPAEAVTGQPHAEKRVFVSIRDPFWFASLVVAGATIASMWGLSAMVLAILGLSGVMPMYMLPVSGIVLGLAFLMLGAVGTAWARMFRVARQKTSRNRIVFFSGLAAALVAGLTAVVLGVLNFAFLGNVRFGAVAVIALGLGLLWHSGVMQRVSRFTYYVTYHGAKGRRPSGPFAVNALSLAPVRDFLVGLGGVILGTLGMMSIAPVVLGFVAMLTISAALTVTASTICGATLATLKAFARKVSIRRKVT